MHTSRVTLDMEAEEILKKLFDDEYDDRPFLEKIKDRTPAEEAERKRRRRRARITGEYDGKLKKTNKIYRRRDLGIKDQIVITYLATVLTASADHIAMILGIKDVSHRLSGLHELQLIKPRKMEANGRNLWTVNPSGIKLGMKRGWITEEYNYPSERALSWTRLQHALSVSQVTSHIIVDLSNKVRDRYNLDIADNSDEMMEIRLQIMQRFITERMCSSRFSRYSSKSDRAETVRSMTEEYWQPYAEAGDFRAAADACPLGLLPVMEKHRSRSRLRDSIHKTKHSWDQITHIPDLLIDRESSRKSMNVPTSIAIEVEISLKDKNALKAITDVYVHSLLTKKIGYVHYYYRTEQIKSRIIETLHADYNFDEAELSWILKRFKFMKLPHSVCTPSLTEIMKSI